MTPSEDIKMMPPYVTIAVPLHTCNVLNHLGLSSLRNELESFRDHDQRLLLQQAYSPLRTVDNSNSLVSVDIP